MSRAAKIHKRLFLVMSLTVAFGLLEGCYYMQAVGGHMEIMRKRRPLSDVIDDAATADTLREQLRMVQQARQFAVHELLLPDNGSYQSFVDLQRDFVVWNVFAAPEFSLKPQVWCFPVVGCVAYRGYFSQDKALSKADKLRKSGLDVHVGGVAAYSTLGRFDDPVLNTMMRWSDNDLVETLFHELAHQKLYVNGDTAFNESFATAVAEIGLQRWLVAKNIRRDTQNDDRLALLRDKVRNLVLETRQSLEELYASKLGESNMRAQKKALMDGLSIATQAAIDASGSKAQSWLAAPLNNARLVALGLYAGNLPAFRQIFEKCSKQLPCFYARSSELAELEPQQRQELLGSLSKHAVF